MIMFMWMCNTHLYVLMLTHQCQAVKAVEREPYTGEVVAVANSGKRDFGASDPDTPTRPCTRHGGVRDLHESSFSLSGKHQQIQSDISNKFLFFFRVTVYKCFRLLCLKTGFV